MQQAISKVLSTFEPITLAEMDSVKLLDRTDTKFIFNLNKLPQILESLRQYYKVLDVNGVKQNRYETLYFDTPTFDLYRLHHSGHMNRYKVRYRKYVDSDLVFFEVKHKTNKGRTLKSRVKRSAIRDTIEGKSTDLITSKTPLHPDGLRSQLWVNYSRITLVNKFSTERLTIDLGLHFVRGELKRGYENLVIAEVKQEKTHSSPFITVMKEHHIREGSISKYCFGVISLIGDVKKNNFKPHLKTVNKVCNDNNTSIAA